MNTNKAIAAAIASVRNLLQAFRGNLDALKVTDGSAEFMFMDAGIGIAFGGREAELYRDARTKLMAVHGHDSHRRRLGERTVEKRLNETILRCLQPSRAGGVASWSTFNRRANDEVRRLRASLACALNTWNVTVRVADIDQSLLPLTFGGIEFVAGSLATGVAVADCIPSFVPSRRTAKRRVEAELASRAKSREEVVERFASGVLARTSVDAGDADAARNLGVARVRQVVDVMNYFAPRFQRPRRFITRAYVGPEGPRASWAWAVVDPKIPFFSTNEERSMCFSIRQFQVEGETARSVGVVRVNEMLQRGRTDLEERIVTGLTWAGRAYVETKRDLAILLYAIALESLLSKKDARAGVSDRLRLRTAHLIGKTVASRRNVLAAMDRLYQIRSAFVHSGAAEDVTDGDVDTIRLLTELACDAVLVGKPFASMKTCAEVDRWFEERLLQADE